jgi:phosphoribosylaminoimidazole-succinocarboxamide synthase
MTLEDFSVCEKAALALFKFGHEMALQRGLLLAETKYEFGKDENGTILLIDELHTPNSSLYWLASSYEQRIDEGLAPDNTIDAKFLEYDVSYQSHNSPNPNNDMAGVPTYLLHSWTRRYITLYEMITWKEFDFDYMWGEDKAFYKAIATAITDNLK